MKKIYKEKAAEPILIGSAATQLHRRKGVLI
jgi:hypothetical protein